MASTIILSDNGASSGSAGLKQTAGNDGVLILQTTTSGGTATNAVYITNTQRVGLGTTSPGTVLQVVGQSAAGIYSSSPSTAGNNYLLAASSSYNYGVVGVKTGDGTSTGDVYQLGVVASAGGTSSGILQWGSASNCVGLSTTPATSGTGISFPASQSASSDANTLDDYEEGTWTPGISPGTSGAVTVQSSTGKYTKVGNVVTVQLGIQFTKNTAVGQLNLTGFPFSFTGTGTNFSVRGPSFDWYEQSGTALISMRGIGINGTTYMSMYALTAANVDGTGRTWDASDTSTVNNQIYSQFSYLV